MGNTTIIELDHDQGHEIMTNPDEFVTTISEQLRSAKHTGKRIPGGRVISFFHRSGAIEEAWIKFKQKWGK